MSSCHVKVYQNYFLHRSRTNMLLYPERPYPGSLPFVPSVSGSSLPTLHPEHRIRPGKSQTTSSKLSVNNNWMLQEVPSGRNIFFSDHNLVYCQDGPGGLYKPSGVVTPPATPPTLQDQGSEQSHYGPSAEINLRKPSLKHDIAR